MAKDPICGMEVDEGTALSTARDGKLFYFCSEHCQTKFVGEGHSSSGKVDGQKSCCGKSGAETRTEHQGRSEARHHHDQTHHESPVAVHPAQGTKYFCPMCPGVESDVPGDCPKCGMALEKNM